MNDAERLDREIDAAARSLVRGEPTPGFARRVTASIEGGRTRPRLVWQLAAAAALVVLIVYILPWSGPRPAVPGRPPQTDHPTVAVRQSQAEPAAHQPAPAAPTARRRVPGSRSAPPAITIDDAALTLTPLPELPELSVPIEGPADLTVEPLEIAELRLPPLVPDEKEPR